MNCLKESFPVYNLTSRVWECLFPHFPSTLAMNVLFLITIDLIAKNDISLFELAFSDHKWDCLTNRCIGYLCFFCKLLLPMFLLHHSFSYLYIIILYILKTKSLSYVFSKFAFYFYDGFLCVKIYNFYVVKFIFILWLLPLEMCIESLPLPD